MSFVPQTVQNFMAGLAITLPQFGHLRSAGCAEAAPRGEPQRTQNFMPGFAGAPHFGQTPETKAGLSGIAD